MNLLITLAMLDDDAWEQDAMREIDSGTDNHNTCPCGLDAHNDTLCEDCREERDEEDEQR